MVDGARRAELCTESIVATIAPGPASSGVPSGTRATLTSGTCERVGSLPVSSSSATRSSSSPPAPCSAGDRDLEVVQDALADDREHPDDEERDELASGPRRGVGGSAATPVRARKIGTAPGGSRMTTRVMKVLRKTVGSKSSRPQHLGGSARGGLERVEHVRGRGVLGEPVALALAVVVARSREQQSEPAGERRGMRDLLGAVVAVVASSPTRPASRIRSMSASSSTPHGSG